MEPFQQPLSNPFGPGTDEMGYTDDLLPELDLEAGNLGTLDDRDLPGESDEETIDLSGEERTQLAKDLCEMLELYDDANRERVRRWDEIEDAYDMVPPAGSGGETPESEMVVSELLMSQVDQAAARLQAALAGAEPLAKVRALRGRGDEAAAWAAEAEGAERVLNNYVRREGGMDQLVPIMCHRSAKLGTCVVHPRWEKRQHVARWYERQPQGEATLRVETVDLGRLRFDLIQNRDVVFWPPTAFNWQDAELVGYRRVYGLTEWRRKARQLKLDEETIERIEGSGGTRDNSEGKTIDPEFEPVELFHGYCCMPIGEDGEEKRFYVWLHEPSRTLARIGINEYPEQRVPFFPVRWKLTDRGGWGDGVGDEVLSNQAMSTMLDNLEGDNLMGGAFKLIRVTPGSMADIALDRPRPGEIISAEQGEIEAIKIGGEAPEVGQSQDRSAYRAMKASGFPPVLAGQGDPTQKSGTGTGATLALIEQAGMKFNTIGNQIKMDLADLLGFSLELIALYAPNGILYAVASKEDASVIDMLRYVPPRRRLSEFLHIDVEAPSAATSQEARKMHYLAMFNFAATLIQTVEQEVGEVLAQENVPAYVEWKKKWAVMLLELARRVIEYHDLPGLSALVPSLPSPTPEQEVIQQQMQQMQQMQQQIQQLTAQLQALLQPQQIPGGGMPPPAQGAMQ